MKTRCEWRCAHGGRCILETNAYGTHGLPCRADCGISGCNGQLIIEKLVRTGPGFRIRADGGKVRVAERDEMLRLLAHKLVEEAREVLAAVDNPISQTAIVEELADVTEVIRGLRRAAHIRKDDIRSARRTKRTREGDFDERLVWMQDG